MPQRLKSREKNVPNGFFFRQPEINWDSRKVLPLHPSFSTLVAAVISARRANPHHAAKHKWSLDRDVVENEVEAFQVKVCQAAGWNNFLTDVGGGSAPPFSAARSLAEQKQLAAVGATVKKLWSGIRSLNDWMKSGEPPVSQEQANSRAATCIVCPLNGQGDFSKWFVAPAAAAVKKQIEWTIEKKLSTPHDATLNICEGCLCGMRLKVHVPFSYIKDGLSTEVIAELRKGKNCWQIKELEGA
jgi:hypothetical protein